MTEDLYVLIRLKKWEVDEKQRQLADLFRHEEAYIQDLKNLFEELLNEQKLVAENPEYSFSYDKYAQSYIKKRDELEELLELTRQKIIMVQDELAILFQELKTYEISQENREKRRAEELKIKEQNKLDEIGLNLHRRRKEEEKQDSEDET